MIELKVNTDKYQSKTERLAESAKTSWKLDYTDMDDESYVISQLADNLILLEMILDDKEHLAKNVEVLAKIVNELKVFSVATCLRHGVNISNYHNVLPLDDMQRAYEIGSSKSK